MINVIDSLTVDKMPHLPNVVLGVVKPRFLLVQKKHTHTNKHKNTYKQTQKHTQTNTKTHTNKHKNTNRHKQILNKTNTHTHTPTQKRTLVKSLMMELMGCSTYTHGCTLVSLTNHCDKRLMSLPLWYSASRITSNSWASIVDGNDR